tara:strand:+ start:2507 stop:2791 length:285 start_codon:yes stop_codon:yes gene_type:complete
MANLYWNEEKAPKKETREALMRELVNCTNDAFDVKFGGDGAGNFCAVYVEVETEKRERYKWLQDLPDKFMGWRIIRIFVPPTYVKEILNWVRGD